jgi:undecaprenyl-diphosphatase
MDYLAFRLINNWAGQHAWLDGAMVAIARYGACLFGVTLLWLWGVRGGRTAASDRLVVGRALAAAGLALALGQFIVAVFPRARPFGAHAVHLLVPPTTDPSFPSDHALAAFAIAVVVVATRRWIGLAMCGLAALMGGARVFVGTHYPLDVLGGAVLGGAIGALVHHTDGWLRPLVELASRWSDAIVQRRLRRPTSNHRS